MQNFQGLEKLHSVSNPCDLRVFDLCIQKFSRFFNLNVNNSLSNLVLFNCSVWVKFARRYKSGQYLGNSFTYPITISVFQFLLLLKSHQEPCSEVMFLSLNKHL